MEPVCIPDELPSQPEGSLFHRATHAIFFEHRLPYQIRLRLDRALNRLGCRYKTIKVDGFRLLVRRLTQDEVFVRNIFVNEEYTKGGFEIQKTDTVIDIGGNIGCFALRAARSAINGRVLCYEPQMANYSILTKNIQRNRRRTADIIAPRCAVAATPGNLRLFIGNDTGLHTTIPERAIKDSEYEEVRSTTLSDIFDDNSINRCNFLKIDCEGAEYEILYNCRKDVIDRIDKIVMEYHSPDRSQKRRLGDGMIMFLKENGFSICDYVDFTDHKCGIIRAKRGNGP